jgi:hypothetical protein
MSKPWGDRKKGGSAACAPAGRKTSTAAINT